MPTIKYNDYHPQAKAKRLIDISNEILEEYEQQGFVLTLRQLYYQLVSRDIIKNSQKSYNSLGNIISQARDGGMIDWNRIEDRTRNVRSYPHWENGQDFMESVVPQYRHDLWVGQETRVFVFVEKEALEQIVAKSSNIWDVPYFANKGYLSSSSVWNVARNMMLLNQDRCQKFIVLHLGDHDPSGIDMSRDIEDRLRTYASVTKSDKSEGFSNINIEVRRLALNMNQIEEYDPPPNPAKETDSRFKSYQDEFGDESWELDALEPSIIVDLINSAILEIVDIDLFNERMELQNQIRESLLKQAGL